MEAEGADGSAGHPDDDEWKQIVQERAVETQCQALRGLDGPFDVAVLFAKTRADLQRDLPVAKAAMSQAGGLWIAWPKTASKVPSDLDGNLVREIGLGAGLVDNKVCAIDRVWSALRFVIRLGDRRPSA